jgi:aspartate/methionine/tyrosine aminotransferase
VVGTSGDPSIYAYGATIGLPELRAAIAARALKAGFAPEGTDGAKNVLLGTGATHALSCAVRAVIEPGDEVLLASPYWPLAHGILTAAGAVVREVPLTSGPARGRDAGEVLRAAATPHTKALYLITPNNPDGTVLSRSDLASIARFAVERDLWVVSDEVYADYTYEGEHVSLSTLPGMEERTLAAYSFSKSHALAGARVGYVLAPEGVVGLARRASIHSVFNVPVASQRVALEALGDTNWVASARDDYRSARDVVARALEGTGARFVLPGGGVYFFPDFASVLGGRPLRALLERAIERGVLLAPGEAFGAAFSTYARICFTSVPVPQVLEGIEALKRAIDDLGAMDDVPVP